MQPKGITDGKTYMDLEHTIGLNIDCNNPIHYVSKKCNSNSNEEKESSNSKSDIDYLSVCGSSIVLSSFSNRHFQTFLRGHTSSIACCEISGNKNLIASSESGCIPDVYIWSTDTKKLIYKFEEHNKTVKFMSFSLDSRFLITIDISNEMYIWDMNSGYIVTKSAIKFSDNICDIKWGGRVKDIKRRQTTDYLFATCGIEQVCIWALTPSNGKLLSENLITSSKKKRTFNCLCFSDSGDLLIVGTLSGDFFIFDVQKLTLLTSYQINCIGGSINCIRSIPIENIDIDNIDPLTKHYFIKIIIGCGDGSISIWEYNDDLQKFIENNKIKNNQIINGSIKCIDINNKNKNKLLIATTKGNIYEIENNDKISTISYNETANIIGVKFPKNINDSFVTVSEKGSIRKWSINDYSISLTHNNNNNNIMNNLKCTCFDLNDEIIITGWNDGCIRTYNSNKSNDGILWNIKDVHTTNDDGNGGISNLKLGYNQKYIISSGFDGSLRIWDIRFKNLIGHLKEHKGSINAIELYSDSRHVLTASKDRSFICWDFAKQKRISCHRLNMGSINDIKLNKKQDIVITVGGDRSITFWDIRQSKPINCIKNAHDIDINCCKITNDFDSSSSEIIATADVKSTIKLWDLNTFNLISKQNAYCGKINDIAFSNDNKQIVSVAKDSSIMLWNIFKM